MRVMVVDDSRQIRNHVSRTLQEFGHSPSVAEDGQVCLDLLAQSLVEVVLLDWNMPVLDGLETLKAIKGNPAYESVKVLMMTTENKQDKIDLALSCGADEYMMKPLTKDVLQEKLDSLFDDFI
jgi:two-component system chemotaxis response regulator CheY